MSDDPIVFVLKVPLTEREVRVLDELQAMLRLTSSLDVVRVAVWRLANDCHVDVRVEDFSVPSKRRSEQNA